MAEKFRSWLGSVTPDPCGVACTLSTAAEVACVVRIGEGMTIGMAISPDDPRLAPISLRKELLAGGHNDKTLARALRTGALRRPRTGAYVDGPLWDGLTQLERYALRVRAAERQARVPVALSHASVLPFAELPTWGVDLADVHLTRLDGRCGRREVGIRQHCGRLEEGDTRTAYGLTLTSPARHALEMTMFVPVEPALVIVNQMLHRGDVTIDDLRDRYDGGMDRWPHTLSTGLVLELADGRLESPGETRTAHWLWRERFPVAIPQYEVFDAAGRLIARLDFALPDFGVWIEFDGRIKYQKHLRPGETVTDAVLREKRREEMVAELTGMRCLRVTWADLEDPAQLTLRLRHLMGRASLGRRAG